MIGLISNCFLVLCRVSLRFTPSIEVDLCGHATLAAAHALYDSGRVKSRNTKITFYTQNSGQLTAVGKVDGTIELDFPATPPAPVTLTAHELNYVIDGFKLAGAEEILFAGRSVYDLLLEITPRALGRLTESSGNDGNSINFDAIARLGGRGVIITCLGAANRSSSAAATRGSAADDASVLDDKRFDFVSRCFFPCAGIHEDPVTGSAHCALAPYWYNSGKISPRETLMAYQASKRGGIILVSLSGAKNERVLLSGPCVTTIKSKLCC